MLEACDQSILTLPTDRDYVDVAAVYVHAVAVRMGFDEEDARSIELATREAVSNVIEHAFEPNERATFEVSCERVPLGLKVAVRDRGIPFDPQTVPECVVDPSTGPEPGCGVFAMRELMDETAFNNLGPAGKESVLVKYLKNRDVTDYFEACELGPFASAAVSPPERRDAGDIVVRAMVPSEAAEVTRCMYRAYGYSHTFESMYYPDRIVQLNREGQMYSAVAVTPDGEVIGHGALLTERADSKIGETGLGVVKPEFRSHGIFNLLEEHLLLKAKEKGLVGVFGRAVTTHTYSQQTGLHFGVRDSALMVGLVPQTAWFKGIAEKLSQRESLVLHFKYLNPPESVTIYPPDYHEDMVTRLYANLGGPVTAKGGGDIDEPEAELDPLVNSTTSSSMGFARIDVHKYGKGGVALVRTMLRVLCLDHYEVIHLYLDLSDPRTRVLVPRFEEMGFFFSGILPAALPGDALILQYLNNVPIDYDKIKVASDTAQELLAYVRKHDPNQG